MLCKADLPVFGSTRDSYQWLFGTPRISTAGTKRYGNERYEI